MLFYWVKCFEQHDAFVSSDEHFMGTFSVITDIAGPVITNCKEYGIKMGVNCWNIHYINWSFNHNEILSVMTTLHW